MLVSLTPAISKNNYPKYNTSSKQNPNFMGALNVSLYNSLQRNPVDGLDSLLRAAEDGKLPENTSSTIKAFMNTNVGKSLTKGCREVITDILDFANQANR